MKCSITHLLPGPLSVPVPCAPCSCARRRMRDPAVSWWRRLRACPPRRRLRVVGQAASACRFLSVGPARCGPSLFPSLALCSRPARFSLPCPPPVCLSVVSAPALLLLRGWGAASGRVVWVLRLALPAAVVFAARGWCRVCGSEPWVVCGRGMCRGCRLPRARRVPLC